MNQEGIQFLAPIIRPNKNFVYKGKKFPIDFSLIKKNSNYFYSRRDQYKNVQDIDLQEEPIEILDDSLHSFIRSCQNESFQINNSNIFPLHQLSIRYEVPNLMALTDKYIISNNKTLIFQSIDYKIHIQNQSFAAHQETSISSSLKKDEESIAADFFAYINNEELSELPVPFLYRVVNHPKLSFSRLNEA